MKNSGLFVAFGAAAVAVGINWLVPQLSALLVAILLGVLVANLLTLPESLQPGLALAAKRVLRIGIVLLGFQLSLIDIAALGWGMILVVIAVVALGFFSSLLLGRWLKIPATQSALIGAGFSICGAAAVAAAESEIKGRKDEEVAAALGLVVVFGTLMIPLVPALSVAAGFSERLGGLWAGGSIHEVAQVVAAAGIIGPEALKVGVVVKLARVLMLAPLLAGISLWHRRRGNASATGTRTPIVPLFVAGFLAAAVIRTTGWLPGGLLEGLKITQTWFLAAAMFALGCGVKIATLREVGGRPVILATLVTVVVALVALIGAQLAG